MYIIMYPTSYIQYGNTPQVFNVFLAVFLTFADAVVACLHVCVASLTFDDCFDVLAEYERLTGVCTSESFGIQAPSCL